jgi:hypothetical protein
MNRTQRAAASAAVLVFASLPAAGQPIFADGFEPLTTGPVPVTDARVFFWSNSAVNHDPGGPEDADVGEPMRAMADAAGLTGCADGDYTPTLTPSMLAETAYPAPAGLNPSMTLGASCWDEDFETADYDVGVLQDNNFTWADGTGWGDVAGAVARVAEAQSAEPNLQRWFLYSYAPDADDGSGAFLPRADFLGRQQAFNAANQALQDAIDAAEPTIGLRYVPIGEVWLDLLSPGGLLADVALTDLFVDTAPHQNLSAAEIMGAVAFSAIYRRPVPASYAPPAGLDARIVARWDDLVARIWTLLITEPLATRVFGPGWASPSGTVYWVAPSGDDADPGTRAQPWGTLDHAVGQLVPGDTLVVDGGTWNASLALETSGTAAAPIRIVGRRGATMGNDTGGYAIRISASHVEVRGFNITGARSGILVGDGLYPLNDVCADPAGFNQGLPPAEQEDFSFNCKGRSETENPVYTDIVIDGVTETGARAVITIEGALDPVTGDVDFVNGIDLTDEVERITIRNYEITGARYGVFADGIEQVRRLDDVTLDNLYIHGTYNYGIRMPARRGYTETLDPTGAFVNDDGERVSITPVPLRTQAFTNLRLQNLRMIENGFTADPSTCENPLPDGEAYGNVLLQGWVGGIVERSVFRNGPYWGIDCLICDDIIYRNNLFSMSQANLDLPRCYPEQSDPWPIVGLEVNGGTGNRVVNNTFYGFQSGIFLSMFPEDFAETEISVEVLNNVFWVADKAGDGTPADAVEVFPPEDILASSEVETFGQPYAPVGGYVVNRTVDYNLANIEVPLAGYASDLGGPNNVVDARADVTFVDGDGGDLRLVAPSGAVVDRGQTLADVFDDFDGNPRPIGTGHDLGAYEGTEPTP